MNKTAKIGLAIFLVALAGATAFFLNKYINFTTLTAVIPPKYEIKEEPKPVETTLFFAGDIMLSRNVAAAMYRTNNPLLPFEKVRDRIRATDISFANLEAPFSDKGDHSVQGSLNFNADPDFVKGLVDAGFDVLSTANNHSADQGDYGIFKTVGLLIDNGIYPLGTPNDCHVGVFVEKNGIKFGFLGYSYAGNNDGGAIPNPNVCDWNDQEQVKGDIENAKLYADFVIVSSHMGEEYKRVPEQANALAARAAIDAGADLFIGHHPHWVQTHEVYKGKYIFYSLGNFVFDQMFSQDTREGLGVEVLFKDKNISRITLLPVIIDDYCCPRWAADPESKSILQKINLTEPIVLNKNE